MQIAVTKLTVIVKQIVNTYNSTDFGKFRASVKIGKSLNDMRKII